MKPSGWWFLAAALLASGCGKQERIESVQLSKILKNNQTVFDSANSAEKDFISNAKAWTGDLVSNGAGHGVQLNQNASVAGELAKSAVSISAQIGQVRQAIDSLPLRQEDIQTVRDSLVTELSQRQRQLQDMRTMLEKSVPEFVGYSHDKTYVGDTYPSGIASLSAVLQSYKTPTDAVGSALNGLKTKYKLSEAEI